MRDNRKYRIDICCKYRLMKIVKLFFLSYTILTFIYNYYTNILKILFPKLIFYKKRLIRKRSNTLIPYKIFFPRFWERNRKKRKRKIFNTIPMFTDI